jgi:phosphoglycerol transferase MdoB-like AlkP superfamily enzyme
MTLKTLQLFATLCVAITMAGGWAHLLELPHKMALSREEYLTVQQIYRGWSLLGIAVVGALVSTAALAVLQRGQGAAFYGALAATLCIALSLGIFFAITYPTNQVTENWTALPETWEELRRRWEYSHAASAILYLVALVSLMCSIIFGRH